MSQKPTYREMLLDPRWQKRRLQELEAHGWKCDACEAKDRTLHVHHKAYWPFCPPWDYPRQLLSVLCDRCHGEETEAQREDRANRAAEGEFHLRIFKLLPFLTEPSETEDLLVDLHDLDCRLVEEGCTPGIFHALWPLTIGKMPRILAASLETWTRERAGSGPRHPLEMHIARVLSEMQIQPAPPGALAEEQ